MHLKRYTDYSLRVLIYLASSPDHLVTIGSIAQDLDISRNHLMKVAKDLVAEGYVTSMKGKNGGLRLRRSADQIHIGDVIRRMEGHFNLVECLEPNNGCRLLPVCRLKPILIQATEAFLKVLDPFTLQDVLADSRILSEIHGDQTMPVRFLKDAMR